MQALRLFAILLLLSFSVACTDPAKVPELTRKLSDREPRVRSQAALDLGRIGPPHAESAVPRLISLLSDPNGGVRTSAAYALRRIDTPEAKRALDAARHLK